MRERRMIQKGLTYIFTADKTWFVDIECFVLERSVRYFDTHGVCLWESERERETRRDKERRTEK